MATQFSKSIFVAILGTFIPTALYAGAWVKKPGDTYTKLAVSQFQRTGVYDNAGNYNGDPDTSYSESALRLYSETGIVNNLSLGLSAPFKQATYSMSGNTNTTTGVGDLDIFIKYGGKLESCALSGKLTGRIPPYSNESGESTGTSGPQNGNVPSPVLGDGSYELTPAAAFGCGLGFTPGWFSLNAGPNFRFGGYGHSIDYGGELGISLIPDKPSVLALKGGFSGIQRISARNDKRTKTYISVLGSLIFKATDTVGIEATGSYIPTGYFVAEGWTASVGVFVEESLWNTDS